jgi:hypothetical protein
VTPTTSPAIFSADDLAATSSVVLDAWAAGIDRDWTVPAGTLEWSCWRTAEHTVDCVFSYAFFLASRATDAYPPFDELTDGWPGTVPVDETDDAWSDLIARSGRPRPG